MAASINQAETPAPDQSEQRWSAVITRDISRDGEFVFAVRTTGIYCRPSCPSRRPNRENVTFFDLNREAEAAGFRACRRCKPNEISINQKQLQAVETACRLIDEADTAPGLEELAHAVGLSRFHFHRVFKQHTGMTPKQYAKARQDQRVRDSLHRESSVTAAIYDAGFEAPTRFYERAHKVLGMKPSEYRDGGRNQRLWYAFAETSLGLVAIAGTTKGITAIRFGDDQGGLLKELQALLPEATLLPAGEEMAEFVTCAVGYIEEPEGLMELPLDIQGTAFQHKVWHALRCIPCGTTATYGDIAANIGQPTAVRAVANACGANPVAVAVPCHRVVRSDGGLGGYRWGKARKETLLRREGSRQ